MSLIKWNPETSFFPSMSSLMDDFFNDNWFRQAAAKGVSVPAVNVKENPKSFKLEVAAPGFKKDDFKLEVKNGMLTISGEAKTETEEKDESFTRREFSYSQFSRSFTLPENVKSDDIHAQYGDGILKVTLPKAKVEEKTAKQIAVN